MMAWATLAREICGYNIAALAEWSWNTGGRDTREFAASWATAQGYTDPEAFADWAELTGPLWFDVCDSDWPICYSWGRAVALLERGEQPVAGEGMFRYYEDEGSFGEKREACARALEIAGALDVPNLTAETRVLATYVRLAEAVFRAADANATLDLTSLGDQDRLRAAAEEAREAGAANADAIRAWRAGLGPEPWHTRVHDAMGAARETGERIAAFLVDRYVY